MRKRHTPPHRSIMIALFWVMSIIMFAFVADVIFEYEMNPNKGKQSDLLPGQIRELVLKPNIYHHYSVDGTINGVPVHFLLDTGASFVSIPEKIARQARLTPLGQTRMGTANGTVVVEQTRIRHLGFGGIELSDVRGVINPHDRSNKILLGMSVLKHLEFTQRDGKLIIRQHP